MSIAGKKSLLQVSTSSTAWTIIDEVSSVTANETATNLDITDFSTSTKYMSRIQGLKDVTWSIQMYRDTGDTAGQDKVRDAMRNDTNLYLRYLPDGTTSFGLYQQVKVSSWNVASAVGDPVTVSVDAEGTGGVTVL